MAEPANLWYARSFDGKRTGLGQLVRFVGDAKHFKGTVVKAFPMIFEDKTADVVVPCHHEEVVEPKYISLQFEGYEGDGVLVLCISLPATSSWLSRVGLDIFYLLLKRFNLGNV